MTIKRIGAGKRMSEAVIHGGKVYLSGFVADKTAGGPVGPRFRRGDVDVSGTIDVTDAVKLLNYLFLGGATPECLDAADFDNSNVADISDAVANLSYQFLGGVASAAPGPNTCGSDPTPDDLGCAVYPGR